MAIKTLANRFRYPLASSWERHSTRKWFSLPAGKTLNELMAWAEENGIDPDKGRISGGLHIWREDPETDKEFEARLQRQEDSEAQHRAWIKAQYARVLEVEAEESK